MCCLRSLVTVPRHLLHSSPHTSAQDRSSCHTRSTLRRRLRVIHRSGGSLFHGYISGSLVVTRASTGMSKPSPAKAGDPPRWEPRRQSLLPPEQETHRNGSPDMQRRRARLHVVLPPEQQSVDAFTAIRCTQRRYTLHTRYPPGTHGIHTCAPHGTRVRRSSTI